MPSLFDLKDKNKREEFFKENKRRCEEEYKKELSLNDGIESSKDITRIQEEGDNVTFNYERLVNESGEY